MDTRHNFGFLQLDHLSSSLGANKEFEKVSEDTVEGVARWETWRHKDREHVLMWPLTFMNLSGHALDFFKLKVGPKGFDNETDLLVILDDLDLALGKMRIREKGSSGGHNGLKSIETHLRTDAYSRLKLGIGSPQEEEVVTYVLHKFGDQERVIAQQVLDAGTPVLTKWLTGETVKELMPLTNGLSFVPVEEEAKQDEKDKAEGPDSEPDA